MAYKIVYNPFTGTFQFVNTGGSGGGVQTVTGLDTDNADPENPIVKIAVDGVTITGEGTPADPLVAVPAGGGLMMEAPLTGDVDGVNNIFTFEHEPAYIVSDSMVRVLVNSIGDIGGNGYTVSGSGPYTVTVSDVVPPTSFIRSFFNPT